MRLIDADALFPYGAVPFVENDGFATADKLYGIIKNSPTIDPESLRPKGRWIWNEEYECWACSNCELSTLNNYRGNSTDSNYCPTCGADMREAHE
jgi:hypothetical protein